VIPPRPRPLPLLTAVLAAAVWLVVTGASGAAAPPPPDARSDTNDPRRIYLADCAFCHGDTGQGTSKGPSLAGVGKAAVYFQLSSGRMPARDSKGRIDRSERQYPEATIRVLVDEVVRMAGGDGPDVPQLDLATADVANGGELYRLNCAACHAWSGEGGALFQREAPSIQPASLTEVAAVVRTGSQNMPAFGRAALSDRQLTDLVAYVDELDHTRDRGGNPLWHLGPFAEGLIALGIVLPLLLAITRWIGDRA
jgi:ubiquinol-cytochrome c reductase cytochrome c subunit